MYEPNKNWIYIYISGVVWPTKMSINEICFTNTCFASVLVIYVKGLILITTLSKIIPTVRIYKSSNPKTATEGVIYKKVFLKISQNSQENTVSESLF